MVGAFEIRQWGLGSGLRMVERLVDTHLLDDVARVTSTRTTSITSPLYYLTFGQRGRPVLFERTATAVLHGTGSSALDDAVRALHEVGRRTGVTGVSLSEVAGRPAAFQLPREPFYMGGPLVEARIGAAGVRDIDAAARRVLATVGRG